MADETVYGTARDWSAAEPDMHEWLESQPTREEWLQARLYDTVRPIVEAAGYVLPATRVACGWSGSGHEACNLGVCYDKRGSAAGYFEMFVSPTLDKPVDVVAVMLHEICHALTNCSGHGVADFGKVCSDLGVTKAGADGKGGWPLQAYPSDELLASLAEQAKGWPSYPHAALNPPPPSTAGGGTGTGGGTKEKQSTRLLKALCGACGYTIRVTMKWAQRGMPTCPCGGAIALDTKEDPQ